MGILEVVSGSHCSSPETPPSRASVPIPINKGTLRLAVGWLWLQQSSRVFFFFFWHGSWVYTCHWLMLSGTFWNSQRCHPLGLPRLKNWDCCSLSALMREDSPAKPAVFPATDSRLVRWYLFTNEITIIFIIAWYCRNVCVKKPSILERQISCGGPNCWTPLSPLALFLTVPVVGGETS